MEDPITTDPKTKTPVAATTAEVKPSLIAKIELTAEELDAALDRWVEDQIRGSPIALATDCWNHLIQSAIPHLKAILNKEV